MAQQSFMQIGGYAKPPSFKSLMDYGYSSPELYGAPVPTISDNSAFLNNANFSDLANSSAQSYMANRPTSFNNTGSGNWFKDSGFLGSTDEAGIKTDGWGGLALGAAQGLGSAYMGLKQYGLAKDQLAFQKSAYNKNYAAQRQSTNTDLADRQAARVAANSSYESVGSYMDKNRIA